MRPRRRRPPPKILDTSAIIDGRLVDVADANFLEGPLLVPQFVLAELQRIADADDPLKRRRGRRGLEVLDRLVAHGGVATEVVHDDAGEGPVDDRLVRLCAARGADLVTTDYNLHRVAGLQGIRVLNLHQLANAVKASFLPGERLSLTIVREGREAGQGLAYLEDGTMVVVEDAAALVGRTRGRDRHEQPADADGAHDLRSSGRRGARRHRHRGLSARHRRRGDRVRGILTRVVPARNLGEPKPSHAHPVGTGP